MRDVEQWSRNLQVEVDGATVYSSMARNENEETIAALYERLAAMESRHARIWGRKLRAAGAWRGMPRPSWTATLLTAVASRFGPDIVARSLAARESAERAAYDAQDDEISAALSDEERFHGWVLSRIASPFEADAVALIFVSRGMSVEGAHVIAQNFIAGALGGIERAKASDDLGDPGGSAWIASLTSWAMFAAGAAVPLVAFAFFTGTTAAIVAILLTGTALFANGSIVTLITGRPPVSAGVRQVGVGFAAAAVTYTLGRLFNVAFA